MKGFFTDEEVEKARIKIDLDDTGPNCYSCGLSQRVQSPMMRFSGKGKKKVLIVAEAPGPEEDERNTQLIGKIGQEFREILFKRNLDLDRDFWKINSVNCWPWEPGRKGKKRTNKNRQNRIVAGGHSWNTYAK